MVKKWIVILIISIGLVAGCIAEYKFVNNAFDFIHDELVGYKAVLNSDQENINKEENVLYVETLHQKWAKKVKILKSLIWHTGIKDIEVGLARIKIYTEQNDYKEALTELEGLIDYVKHYREDFTLSLENLF